MKWKALAACTLAGLALIAAGCGGGDKAAAGGAKAGGQDLKGKKLVMYVSFHEDTAKELADLFKKQTGADVSFIRLPTGDALIVKVKGSAFLFAVCIKKSGIQIQNNSLWHLNAVNSLSKHSVNRKKLI